MHVIFIADESILPTDHGGRLVMSNDVKALRAAGVTVSLVVSVDAPQPPDMAGHYSFEFVSAVHFTLQRPLEIAERTHPWAPRASSVRLPDEESLRALRAFLDTQPIPTAIIADREAGLLLGRWIAESSRAPLLLRSQNDEISYMKSAASDSASAEEARALRSEARLLRTAFRRLLEPVEAVALISPDDARRYARIGKRTAVVPALVAETAASTPPFDARQPRAAFVGSLTMPHTAAGLQWYVQRVWPDVRRSLPAAELAVAGRGASGGLLRILEQTDGVTYLGRIDEVQPLLDGARVFINPVFKGSGVNMKLAQPAASGVPVVATEFGMRGAAALNAVVEPSDKPARLAQQTLRYLRDPVAWNGASDALRSVMSSTYSRTASAQAWKDFVTAGARLSTIDGR